MFKDILIDLCASFASANGVDSRFYFTAGKRLVEEGFVSVQPGSTLLSRLEEEAFFKLMVGMRHPRGEYVARLVANRICRSVDQINDLGGTAFLDRLSRSDFPTASKLLLPLYGVGPGFVKIYCLLAGIEGQD